MDFDWSPEERTLIDEFERFCRDKIEPRAEKLDIEPAKSDILENLRMLGDFGFLGAPIPQKYGGSGMRWVTYFALSEKLAEACASTYLSSLAHTLLCANFIAMFGTEEQKIRYLPKLCSGEWIGCLCATEPDVGSDLGALKTKAKKDGKFYYITGTKSYATNGPIADVFVVLARVQNQKYTTKKYDGITAFIVERGTEGFQVGNPYNKLGVRGSPTSDVYLEEAKVLEENIVGGTEGNGFKQVMKVFDIGRIGLAVFSLGIVSACLKESKRYSKERCAFGKPIAYYEDVCFKIADMQVTVDMGRAIIMRAAWMQDMGMEDAGVIASCAKLFVAERATKNASDALQIFGGLGYIKGTKVERLYRDVKLGEIGEGTNEIQRRVIFKRLMREFGHL